MATRELTISESINLAESREFNHLRIKNLDQFLNSYINNLDHYKLPYEILADLEFQIKFNNVPEKVILCSYKDGGDAIFNFVELRMEENIRIVEYEFSTFAS